MRTAFVIPTFNRAGMVEQAVESALAQTIPVKVVVVDDGSTDDTAVRLARFGDRIILHRQENAERGASRNRGAALAPDADLLIFLDADDWVEAGHAASLIALAERHREASLVATRAWEAGANLAPARRLPGAHQRRVDRDAFLAGRAPLPPSVLGVPRGTFQAVGGFPEDRALAGSEDWVFVARALALGPAYQGTEETVRIRKHEGNSMSDARSMHRSMLLAHDALFGPPTPPKLRPPPRLAALSRGDLLVRAAVGHYAVGDMSLARRTLLEGVRAAPFLLLRPLPWWTAVRSLLGRRLTAGLRGLKNDVRHKLHHRSHAP